MKYKGIKERLLDFLSNKFIGLLLISFLIYNFANKGVMDFKAYGVLAIIYIVYCFSNTMIKYFYEKALDVYKNKD